MQGLQELWGIPIDGNSWATGGYMGAIASGRSSCGLLVGSGAAIGLRCGRGVKGRPEENEERRNRAVNGVAELYREFIKEFGSTDCKALSGCDFSMPDDVARYIESRVWKEKCDVYLRFVFEMCNSMAEEERI